MLSLDKVPPAVQLPLAEAMLHFLFETGIPREHDVSGNKL
jgi:hypothetical protein